MVIDRATKRYYKRVHMKNKVYDGFSIEHTKYLNKKGDFSGVKTHDRHTFVKVIIYGYNFHLVHIFCNCCLLFGNK